MKHITVLLLSAYPIVTSGLRAILSSVREATITTIVTDADNAVRLIESHRPTAVIADPLMLSPAEIDELRRGEARSTAFISISPIPLPPTASRSFDAQILYNDSTDSIVAAILRCVAAGETSADGSRELSPREREVVVGIVKGLSNKEIAAEINVSVNTVMTHRRNIAAKLQIHSAAGLTIYAIVSKLVKIDEIKAAVL